MTLSFTIRSYYQIDGEPLRVIIRMRSGFGTVCGMFVQNEKHLNVLVQVFWQGREDLNPQPFDLESNALPIELRP
jgi:hypothetical protein